MTPIEEAKRNLKQCLDRAPDKAAFVNEIRDWIHDHSPWHASPVDRVTWVPVEMVESNQYNPNSVAKTEMRLLLHSIDQDGFTQPVVTVWDPERGKFVVVDGFHRYTVVNSNAEIRGRTHGCVPIVVLKKGMADRMASTVRHNRARGKHSVAGMANLVFQMLEQGKEDVEILAELGMEPDELLRLKHVTGFSKLFENVAYRKAWETRKMIQLRQEWKETNEGSHPETEQDQALPQQSTG